MRISFIASGLTFLIPLTWHSPYRLIGKEFKLFSYEITHSVFTHASYAKVLTEKENFPENTPLELHLVYDYENILVFKGYVEEVYILSTKNLKFPQKI